MKKLIAVLLCLAMVFAFAGCDNGENAVTINVYNWGEYIDDEVMDVNAEFTKRTGIKVNYKTFENNETMYTLLSNGGADYDVVCPSDYMMGKMIHEGMMKKLNFDNIPNYKYIGDEYKNLAYDPKNEYSVPYTWGTVGIFYNSNYVSEEDVKQNWDILWNKKYEGKILMFDNPRDAFAIALQKLGYSLNTTNENEWSKAYDLLEEQKPLVLQYVNDQVYDLMINEEAWIAPYYAGDANIMIYDEAGNENIKFYIPESGTNFFVDCWGVLANSKHPNEAEQYINFLCETEVAKANAEYIGYSTPHVEARKVLDPEVGENPYFYPSKAIMDKTEMFLPLDDKTNKLQADLWLKLRQ